MLYIRQPNNQPVRYDINRDTLIYNLKEEDRIKAMGYLNVVIFYI